MTPGGYKALVAEQQQLASSRPQVKEPEARAQLDHRLALLQATLESVRVVELPLADGTVRFGSVVTLSWEDGKTQVIRLVGPDEADGKDGRINVESPLARTLLEHHEGEEVEVVRPRGVSTATLVSVR